MASERYSLSDVLAVAKLHPFYVPGIEYPPDIESIKVACERATKDDLGSQPLLNKGNLYKSIERLVNDTSPQNTYRQGVYASITGGGFGSKPLFFATDVHENRRHRAQFGRFLRATGLVQQGDWVLTTHCSGELYRSLDLVTEILENAGACVLCAGNQLPPAKVVHLLATYHANVLTGDSSQIVQIVHHLSTLPSSERGRVKLDKIIFTSEVLTESQRAYIRATLGPVKICSIIGSAEAGPWAASNPDILEKETTTSTEDFVFDTRAMLIEIFPLSVMEESNTSLATPLAQGERGIIVQTSLSRLRNPVVRYITGDVGSLHPLPEQARAIIPPADWPFFQILRLEGRDRRFSFDWDGEYIEFENLAAIMNNEDTGILQWQVILDKLEPSLEASLEVRLLCAVRSAEFMSYKALTERIETFFHVYAANEHRFKLVFVIDIRGFERSNTGGKVIKFINRYNI